MTIPDYQSLMLPLLRHISDGQEHSFRSLVDAIAAEYKLTDSERRELLPSGGQFILDNRLGWARTYMKKAGLLSSPKRGSIQITERGLLVFRTHPDRVDNKILRKFPEFLEFQSAKGEDTKATPDATIAEQLDPQESIEAGYQKIRKQLSTELLARMKTSSPEFFERLVVELLLKMGYGGSRKEAGEAIGKAGDEGVDGIINEDRLGLDVVYLQAKKWDGTVGRPEVQRFVGALHGKRARKGVLITTGAFSADALSYVDHIEPRVVLIDGRRLAELMIDFELGVSTTRTFPVWRVDSDYFDEI